MTAVISLTAKGEAIVNTLRPWMAFSWVMLVGAMGGGGLLLRRASLGDPSSFDLTWIRAFHAHGGVLVLMSIVYVIVLDGTALSALAKRAGSAAVLLGTAALAGGFFVHALLGQPGEASIGNAVTIAGAAALAAGIGILIYGLLTTRASAQR